MSSSAVCRRGALTQLAGIVGLTLIGGASLHPQAAAEDARKPWSSLHFRASKWMLSASSHVERSESGLDRSSLPNSLIEASEEAFVDGPFWRLSIESRYVGRVSTQAVWFDRRGAIVLSRSWRRSGLSSYWNERAYAPDGVHRHRRWPASKAEAGKEAPAWSKTRIWTERYPAGWKSCDGLAEPVALLHLLSTGEDLPEGLCFLSQGSLWRLELKRTKQVPLSVDYLDGRQEPERRVEGTVEAQRLELHPRSVLRESGDGQFRLLGLQGDIVIFLDLRGRFPLRLTGRARTLGRVVVALTEVR